MEKLLIRGCSCCLAVLVACFGMGCSSDGHFTIFGYSTQPNYDPGIHTVYVPIFQNVTNERYLEFELTRAVIREIEAKTPFKVVDCRADADTELIGKIVARTKSLILQNNLGEAREAQVGMNVELTWRDLRPGSTGVLLSTEPKKEEVRGEEVPPQVKGAKPPTPTPTLVSPAATYIPELGGSNASARQQLVNRAAIQIVSMMEKAW
jgi:hypothetical protein